jgi:hypothetical protein
LRQPLSFRASGWVRRELDMRCRDSGRTVSAEIEAILEQALRAERPIPATWEAAYGGPTAGVLWLIAELMRAGGHDWPDDPDRFAEIVDAVHWLLHALDPAKKGNPLLPPANPACRLLVRYCSGMPGPADEIQAQWLRDRLSRPTRIRLRQSLGQRPEDIDKEPL